MNTRTDEGEIRAEMVSLYCADCLWTL